MSFWENEERIPNAKVIIILSRYFQVSCDYILCITNDSSTVYRQDDYNIDMSVFSQRLKDLRLKQRVSQEKLAQITKTSQSSINFWELGLRSPSAQAVVNLAEYFKVTTDYLLGESD